MREQLLHGQIFKEYIIFAKCLTSKWHITWTFSCQRIKVDSSLLILPLQQFCIFLSSSSWFLLLFHHFHFHYLYTNGFHQSTDSILIGKLSLVVNSTSSTLTPANFLAWLQSGKKAGKTISIFGQWLAQMTLCKINIHLSLVSMWIKLFLIKLISSTGAAKLIRCSSFPLHLQQIGDPQV